MSTTPSLLPIFRSQQQAELLTLVLGDPTIEGSLPNSPSEQAIPYDSVRRELEGITPSGSSANNRL